MAFATLLGALAAATAILVTHLDTEKTLKVTQRAYLTALPTSVTTSRGSDGSVSAYVIFTVKVTGQSPALKTNIHALCDTLRSHVTKGQPPALIDTTVLPNVDVNVRCRVFNDKSDTFSSESEVEQQQFDVTASGEYEDIFGVKHRYISCYLVWIDPLERKLTSPNHLKAIAGKHLPEYRMYKAMFVACGTFGAD